MISFSKSAGYSGARIGANAGGFARDDEAATEIRGAAATLGGRKIAAGLDTQAE